MRNMLQYICSNATRPAAYNKRQGAIILRRYYSLLLCKLYGGAVGNHFGGAAHYAG